MTISSETNKNRYSGNDSTTVFPYTFKINAADQILVTIADDNDTQTELILDTDYTVSGVGDAGGGNITYTGGGTPLPSDWTITLQRDVSIVQLTDFENQGGFFADTHEDAFDKLTMIVQQQQEELDRCPKVTSTSGDTGAEYLETIEDAVLAAAASEAAAASSETNAAASEAAAGVSETNAAASETAAGLSETAAGLSETNAAASETAASESEVAAGLSETNASDSAIAAAASEIAAGQSETAAGLSETNAAASETAAGISETNAGLSETNAAASAALFPEIEAGDAGKFLKINETEDGYDTSDVVDKSNSTNFKLGDGTDVNNELEADIGETNNPIIRFNVVDDVWEFSNNGTTYAQFGSGSGGGSLDVVAAEDFETRLLTELETGNNATFLGGGSLAGTLSYETTSPISDDQSLKYIQAGGSLNDYVALPSKALDDKQKGNLLKITQYFTYDGDAEDINVYVWDVTNSVNLAAGYFSSDSNPTRYEELVLIPEDCDEISVGFQVATANTGAILLVDDIELSMNAFVKENITQSQSLIYDGYGGYGSTNTAIPYFDTEERNVGADLLTISNSTVDGFSITAKQDTYVIFSLTGNQSAARNWGISKDSNQLTTSITSITASHRMGVMYSGQSSTNDSSGNTVFAGMLLAGETLRPHTEGSGANSNDFRVKLTVLATAENPAVLTPAKAGSHTIRYDGYTSRDGSGFIKFKTKQYEHTVGGVSLLSEDNTGTFTKYTALDASYFDFSLGARLTSTGDFELRRYNSSGVEQEAYRREFIVNASVSAKIKMNKGDYVLGYSAVDAVDVVDATIFQVTATPLYATLMAALPKDIQYDLTVTGSNWTTIRAVGIPYEAANGVWRMKFNVTGSISSVSQASQTLTIAGVTFKNITNFQQGVTCFVGGGGATACQARVLENSSTLACSHTTLTVSAYRFSGDVELDSKPTFL